MLVFVKRHSVWLGGVLSLALSSSAAGQQTSQGEEVSPRITRLERWLSAIASHRPGAVDDSVRLINSWNQEQLRLVWVDVSSIVSLVREPDIQLFYVSEPQTRSTGPTRPVSPLATNRSTQVLYTVGELRRLRAIAKTVSPTSKAGPENDILKRGAMLHADIAIMTPVDNRGGASDTRPGPGGLMLFMNDGQQLGLQEVVSHWNMGRRLLDRVRPVDTKDGMKTVPNPAGDEDVRRWYVVGCAYMTRVKNIEPSHFTRALELFPNDPEVLFFAASAHETFAGVRTQAVMRSMRVPRGVSFEVEDEDAELRRAEQLYKRAIERNPNHLEARIRLGRVLGLRGRHKEAVDQLRQGQVATEPVLQYYAHLFLGGEFEALGNGAEARQSYERAAALAPTAQSPLFGLSRLADQAGDRGGARELIARVFALGAGDEGRVDPWWVYEIVQARSLDRLLADLHQRIVALPE